MNDSTEHELISAYLDGQLTPAEREQVERMLAESAETRQLCDDLRSLRTELLALPRQRTGVDFAARVMAAIGAETAANRNGVPQPHASSDKTEPPAEPPLASPRRDLPPGGGLSWAAVAALLGTLAAGIVAILTLPMPWNQVAGPNIPNVPTLPAPAVAKRDAGKNDVRKNVEQPLAAAPSDPLPPAASADPGDGLQNGHSLGQNAKGDKAAPDAAARELVNAKSQKQREKTDPLQDRLAGPKGQPAIAAPAKPADFAEKPGKSLPESEEDRVRRANRGAGPGGGLPLAPMTGDVAVDQQNKILAKAEGAERKELYAAVAPDAGGEEQALRRAVEKQGIVWTQAEVRARSADRHAALGVAGRRPADEETDKLRADRAATKYDSNRYYMVEAPETNIDQLIADLRKQGIDVQIAPADGVLDGRVAKRDARRELIQPQAGFGGGRGFAPAPSAALPLPAAEPPAPAAPVRAIPAPALPAPALPAPAPPGAPAGPMPFRIAGGAPAPGAAPATLPAPGEDAAAAGEAGPPRAGKRGEERLENLPKAAAPPANLKQAERPDLQKDAVGYVWLADPREAVEFERAKLPQLPETDLAPEAAAAKPSEEKPAARFADAKPGQGSAGPTGGPIEPRVRVLLILRRPAAPPAADPAK